MAQLLHDVGLHVFDESWITNACLRYTVFAVCPKAVTLHRFLFICHVRFIQSTTEARQNRIQLVKKRDFVSVCLH